MHFIHLRKRPEQPVFYFFNTVTNTLANQCRRIHLKHFNKRPAPPPSSVMLIFLRADSVCAIVYFLYVCYPHLPSKIKCPQIKKKTSFNSNPLRRPCVLVIGQQNLCNVFCLHLMTYRLKHSLWIEELAFCELACCLLLVFFLVSVFSLDLFSR